MEKIVQRVWATLKKHIFLKNSIVLSQLFSSAVSALLIIGLILLDPTNSDSWSLAYSSYMVLLALIRSIFSEPLIYEHAVNFTSELVKKGFISSIVGSTILSSFFYFITGNIYFFFLILPSIVNVFQDFTRFGLISLDLKRALVFSDMFWFFCTSILLFFLYFFPNVFEVPIYILIWSLFGFMSCLINLNRIKTVVSEKILIKQLTFGFLQFSLLIDKIFPRLVSEAQYFLLNIFVLSSISEYRIANLLMGFSNVLIMSHLLNWISVRERSNVKNQKRDFFVIIFLNFAVAGVAMVLSEQLISFCIIGLTFAAILDFLVTRRVITKRLLGSEYLLKTVSIRVESSLLLLVGFTASLLILPFPWSVASAAAIGSLLSLLSLRFNHE